jgi:alpha-galactosidase/6-phospho-beta-glucosidase family protein
VEVNHRGLLRQINFVGLNHVGWLRANRDEIFSPPCNQIMAHIEPFRVALALVNAHNLTARWYDAGTKAGAQRLRSSHPSQKQDIGVRREEASEIGAKHNFVSAA